MNKAFKLDFVKRIKTKDKNMICFEVNNHKIWDVIKSIEGEKGCHWNLSGEKWYDKRSSKSNRKFHKELRNILEDCAMYSGQDIDDIKDAVKQKAVSMGYPSDIITIGEQTIVRPKRSRYATTDEISILIQAAQLLHDFLIGGIR
jgi:hypothetical protein